MHSTDTEDAMYCMLLNYIVILPSGSGISSKFCVNDKVAYFVGQSFSFNIFSVSQPLPSARKVMISGRTNHCFISNKLSAFI